MTLIQRAFRGARNDWGLYLLSVFSVAVAFVSPDRDPARGGQRRPGARSLGPASGARPSTFAAGDAGANRGHREGAQGERGRGRGAARLERGCAARGLRAAGDPAVEALPAEASPRVARGIGAGRHRGRARSASSPRSVQVLPAVESVETYGSWSERLGTVLGRRDRGAAARPRGVRRGGERGLVDHPAQPATPSHRGLKSRSSWARPTRTCESPSCSKGRRRVRSALRLALLLLGIVFLVVQSHVDRQIVAPSASSRPSCPCRSCSVWSRSAVCSARSRPSSA